MIHLVKLCVGVSSFDELESYRNERAHWWGADYGEEVHVHRTRTTPKRGDELLAGGGSIYWVISGVIRCRQPILRFQAATDKEGKDCCDIIMSRDMVRTLPYPKRPFQGWRYLEPKDAPPDMATGAQEEGSEFIAEELARLGLL
ncbi:DUF1489 family protein [Paradevosia shaoguanensis]|uniref:DUF1489 family protein n=1 Tax=Paradevosia shaoguanensis TaxID=1335043 RepID=UPI003C76D0B3